MASDFFESDHHTSDADTSSQSEVMTDEAQPAASRRTRHSLFQIVCLQAEPKTKPPTSL